MTSRSFAVKPCRIKENQEPRKRWRSRERRYTGGGGKHVGEEEIGKDGTELGLKGVLTGAGNGGGGGGGCDPLAQFVDEVGEVRHGRRRGFPSPSHWPR